MLGTTFVNPRVQYRNQLNYVGKLKACVFDWSGTVVDCGVFGPTVVFMEVFKNEGIPITIDEARGPMGTHKKVTHDYICTRNLELFSSHVVSFISIFKMHK